MGHTSNYRRLIAFLGVVESWDEKDIACLKRIFGEPRGVGFSKHDSLGFKRVAMQGLRESRLQELVLEGVLKGIGCDGKHSKIPPSPLFKGGTGSKVPLFKGDLGGSR
jgi:hypothetical protein